MPRWVTIAYLVAGVSLIFGLIGLYYLLLDWKFNRTILALPVGIVISVFVAWIDSYRGVGRDAVAHLGEQWNKGTVLAHPVKKRDRVNVQLGINALAATTHATRGPIGIDSYKAVFDALRANAYKVPVRWANLPKSLTEFEPCVENGLYFLTLQDGTPFIAFVTGDQLEVMASTPEATRKALDAVLREADRRSVYRGQVVTVELIDPGEESDPDYVVRFADLAPIDVSEIVLPPDVMAVGLGTRILRADTAALAALACWQALVGDWRHPTPRLEVDYRTAKTAV
jgi:hypothetical protein